MNTYRHLFPDSLERTTTALTGCSAAADDLRIRYCDVSERLLPFG